MPPGVRASWEDCDVMTQAHLLAYDQLRSHDQMQVEASLAGAKITKGMS